MNQQHPAPGAAPLGWRPAGSPNLCHRSPKRCWEEDTAPSRSPHLPAVPCTLLPPSHLPSPITGPLFGCRQSPATHPLCRGVSDPCLVLGHREGSDQPFTLQHTVHPVLWLSTSFARGPDIVLGGISHPNSHRSSTKVLVPRCWVPACAQQEGAGSCLRWMQHSQGCRAGQDAAPGAPNGFACGWTLLSVLPQLLRAGLCSP